MPLSGRNVLHTSAPSHAGDIDGRHDVPAAVPIARHVPWNGPVRDVASGAHSEPVSLQRAVAVHAAPFATLFWTQRPEVGSSGSLQTAPPEHGVDESEHLPPSAPSAKHLPWKRSLKSSRKQVEPVAHDSLMPQVCPAVRVAWHVCASASQTSGDVQVPVQLVPAVVPVWVQTPSVPVALVATQSWFIEGVVVFCGQLVSHTLQAVVAEMKHTPWRHVRPESQPPLALHDVSAAVPFARQTPEMNPRSPLPTQVDVEVHRENASHGIPSATSVTQMPEVVSQPSGLTQLSLESQSAPATEPFGRQVPMVDEIAACTHVLESAHTLSSRRASHAEPSATAGSSSTVSSKVPTSRAGSRLELVVDTYPPTPM
jgi:hypothetical protein